MEKEQTLECCFLLTGALGRIIRRNSDGISDDHLRRMPPGRDAASSGGQWSPSLAVTYGVHIESWYVARSASEMLSAENYRLGAPSSEEFFFFCVCARE